MVGLYVEYKAKTQELDQALSRMGREIDQVKTKQTQLQTGFNSMHSNISSGLNSILGHWKAIVSAIAVYNIVGIFNETAEAIDRLTDTARGLGVVASDFQALAYAAQQSGVDVGSLEQAMSKMTVTLGQVAQGTTKLNGLNVKDILSLEGDEQFVSIVKALEDIKNPTLQAQAAFEVFGKSYKEVLKIVRDGSLIPLVDEFHELGLALTDSQRQAVDAMGDAKAKLGAIWEGFTQKIVAYISPAFGDIVAFINDTILKMGGIDEAAQKFSRAIVSGVQAAVSAVNSLINGLESVQKILLFIENRGLAQKQDELLGTDPGAGKYNLRPDQFKQPKDFVKNLQNSGDSYLPSIQFTMSMARLTKQIDENYNTLNEIEQNAKSRKDFLKPLQDTIEKDKDKIGAVISSSSEGIKSLGGAALDTADSLKQAGDKISNIIKGRLEAQTNERLESIFKLVKGPSTASAFDNEHFDSLAAKLIEELQQGGDPNGGTVQSGLATLSGWARDIGSVGQLGVVEELKKYIRELGGKEQKVKVDIKVEPNENFWIKWATDQNVQNTIAQQVVDIATKTARQMRGA